MTLIEVLIVVVVVAILALIVIPRLMAAGRRAREAALRATLQELRYAIRMFEAEYGGHPCRLKHLMGDKTPGHCHADSDGHRVEIPPNTPWNGPYLTTSDGKLPVDPITGRSDWKYDSHKPKGHVSSNAAGTGLDGTPYSSW